MGMIDDVLKTLDRIPIWKRLGEVPEEMDDLNRRVADLEEKLGGTWPADVCRFCGKRAARLADSTLANDKGYAREEWFCAECNNTDTRAFKVK